jgi:hypothetical protein
MLEPPELVTLIEEEEPPPPPLDPELKIIRQFIIDAAVVIAVKVVGVIAVHRLVKSTRAMNKINIPHQWWRDEEHR